MNRQKQHRGAAAALAVLVLAAVLLFVGGSWLEKRSQKPGPRTELPQETAETMEVDGVTYTYYTVTGKVVDGEIVVNLKGRQVKLYGSNFVLVAVKTIED